MQSAVLVIHKIIIITKQENGELTLHLTNTSKNPGKEVDIDKIIKTSSKD